MANEKILLDTAGLKALQTEIFMKGLPEEVNFAYVFLRFEVSGKMAKIGSFWSKLLSFSQFFKADFVYPCDFDKLTRLF